MPDYKTWTAWWKARPSKGPSNAHDDAQKEKAQQIALKEVKKSADRQRDSERIGSDRVRAGLITTVSALLVGAVGLTVYGVFWERPDMVEHGSIAVAALVVSATASVGLKSWSDERRNSRHVALEQRRRDAYTEILKHATVGPDGEIVSWSGGAGVRADIAVWASAEVVQSLIEWNEAVGRVRSAGAEGHSLSDELDSALKTASAKLHAVVRAEVNGEELLTQAKLEAALYAPPFQEAEDEVEADTAEEANGRLEGDGEPMVSREVIDDYLKHSPKVLVESGFPTKYEFVSKATLDAAQRAISLQTSRHELQLKADAIATLGKIIERNYAAFSARQPKDRDASPADEVDPDSQDDGDKDPDLG